LPSGGWGDKNVFLTLCVLGNGKEAGLASNSPYFIISLWLHFCRDECKGRVMPPNGLTQSIQLKVQVKNPPLTSKRHSIMCRVFKGCTISNALKGCCEK
jgi:hypothetical protein